MMNRAPPALAMLVRVDAVGATSLIIAVDILESAFHARIHVLRKHRSRLGDDEMASTNKGFSAFTHLQALLCTVAQAGNCLEFVA